MSQALSENIRTIRVGITGNSSTASYTLAPGLAQYVESVYIEVTNNAAGAVHPVLTIAEQAGVVIAKRRQGGTIAASGSGSATWALRLSGDDSGDTGLTGIFYDVDNAGDWLHVDTGASPPVGEDSFTLNVGQDWTLTIARDWNINSIGQDLNATIARDVNLDPGNDWNAITGRDWNTESARDTNIIADRRLSMTSKSTSLAAQVTLKGGANVIGAHDKTVLFYNRTISFGDFAAFTLPGFDSTDWVTMQLATGKTFTIYDNSGNPIFRVDEDGSLHGKTGKTLTFDL